MRGWLSGGIVLLVLLAPAAAAQMGHAGANEIMKLTAEAPSGAQAPSDPVCGTLSLHGLAQPGEGPEQDGKASTSRTSVVVGCPTLFRAPTPGAFNLTQDITAHLFFGCEQPTVMHQPLNNLRVWLIRNGEDVSEGQASLDTVCSPGTPMEVQVAIGPPEDPSFGANDTIGFNVTAFGSPNAVMDNIHLLVGGNETASMAHLPGMAEAFEEPQQIDEAEDSVDNETEGADNGTDVERQSAPSGADGNGIPGPGVAWTAIGLASLALARRLGRG